MTTNNRTSQTSAVVADQKAMAGVDKYLGSATQVTLQNKPYAPAAIKAALQAEIDANTALATAKAALHAQVATTQTVRATALAMRAALRSYILGTYGAGAVQVFEDFGMIPPKPAQLTAQVKAEAQAKAKATRAAKKTALAKATQPASAIPQVSTIAPTK